MTQSAVQSAKAAAVFEIVTSATELQILATAGAIFLAWIVGATGPRLLAPQRWNGRRRGPYAKPAPATVRPSAPSMQDPTDQLKVVMEAVYEKKRLMSKDEAQVFLSLEREVKARALPWRVMAQVSLGEIIRSPDRQAHAAINSKRVDLLVIAANGEPLAAVEFQGSGHYLGTAAARDAVKREALRRAGVAFIEVTPAHTTLDIGREVERLAAGRSAVAA